MLRIEEISASYGKFNIINSISIEVADGSTIITLGPNGAGKSTLLKVISGLLKPGSGTIYFDGQRIDGKDTHEIIELGISLVPEGGRVFAELKVNDNLRVGAYPTRARKYFKENLREVFQLFPILEERKNQIAGFLSGGERQMLAIARALMSQPKLIMLDEPSGGLAPLIVKLVFEYVERIKSRGYSILMVEQNAVKALGLADYVYLLESGIVRFHGRKEEFIQNPHIKTSYLGV